MPNLWQKLRGGERGLSLDSYLQMIQKSWWGTSAPMTLGSKIEEVDPKELEQPAPAT